jgi:uncharacterized protein Smg (DUF494 family)
MSERIKEIIEYIMDLEAGDLKDPSFVQDELEDMGYTRFEIRQAFRMLDFGSDVTDRGPARETPPGNRVLNEFEKHMLSIPAQGYLLNLHRLGWISEIQLSAIIDNAAFEFIPPVSLEEVRDLASRFVSDLPEDNPPDVARRDDGHVH